MAQYDITRRSDPFRWVIVLCFAFINLPLQALWIGYAPIAETATRFYGVDGIWIHLLALVFGLTFVLLGPASARLILRRGLHASIGGAAIVGAMAGVGRGLGGDNYAIALACTLVMAAIEPILMLSWTALPTRWFHFEQRATALSLIVVSTFAGMGLGMIATPWLVDHGVQLPETQKLYGGVMLFAGLVFALIGREEPDAAPEGSRAPTLDLGASVRRVLRHRVILGAAVLTVVPMGCFYLLTTFIEDITGQLGSGGSSSGLGGSAFLGASFGCVTISAISDIAGRRVPFLAFAGMLVAIGLWGLTIRNDEWATAYLWGFVFGYGIGMLSPIGLQYAAEIGRPANELVSGGTMLLAAQFSVGYAFVMSSWAEELHGFTVPLRVSALLTALAAAAAWWLFPEPALQIGIGARHFESVAADEEHPGRFEHSGPAR